MLLHVIDYQLDATYQPGTKMNLSDALSWLTSHSDNSKAKTIPGLEISVHDVEVFTEMSSLSLPKSRGPQRLTQTRPQNTQAIYQWCIPREQSWLSRITQSLFQFQGWISCMWWPDSKRTSSFYTFDTAWRSIKTATHISHGYCQNKEQSKNKFILAAFESRCRKLFVHMSCLCNISGETTCRVSPEWSYQYQTMDCFGHG